MHSLDRKTMLCQFFKNKLSESEIKKIKTELPLHYHLIYHMFDLLRDAGAESEDILNAEINDGNVVIGLSSKSIAKIIEKNDSNYKFGGKEFSIKIRRNGNMLSATSKCKSE